MANISREEIRAEIDISGTTFSTPAIKSFSVSKSRQSLSAQFSASIEVSPDDFTEVGGDVVIRAGLKGQLKTIFTGVIRNASAKPSWEDAFKVILNISGNDRMYILDDKKFSRRALNEGLAPWASITSVSRRQQVSQYNWKRKNVSIGKIAFLGNEKFMSDSRIVSTPEINDPLLPFISKATDMDDREIVPSAEASFILEPSAISTIPYTGDGTVDPDGNLKDTWTITLDEDHWGTFTAQDTIADGWTSNNVSVVIISSVTEDPVVIESDTPPAGSQCEVKVVGTGQATIRLTDSSGNWGICTVLAIVPHTHERFQGDAAFGSFA
ncbi:MAG TPA: hypothetical protein ENI23_04800 [bacterium]|nr:hypothetical protein [bacterium]